MSVFAVIPTRLDHKLGPALDAARSSGVLQYLQLPQKEYLVSFRGTSTELSDLLKITGGENGLAIVLAISSYYGRTSTDTWEWIKNHWEA